MKIGKILKQQLTFIILTFALAISGSALAQDKIEEKEIDISNTQQQEQLLDKENTSNKDEALKEKVKKTRSVISYDFSSVISEILPSVVNISAKTDKIREEKPSSIGSGIISSKDGYILTSYHVIKDAKLIEVGLYNNKRYNAQIIGYDEKTDLALLKIDANDLKPAEFGNSRKVRIGNWVIIVGNPYGLGQSVSTGIISAKGRNLKNGQIQEYIQTDAAINNGNSGGPMFNLDGEIIGINTAILSPSGGSVGLGFATPSETANYIISQLKDNGRVIRGWVGVTVRDISQEIADAMNLENNYGAFINDITANGPADIAGLVASDIVIKIDDIEIKTMKTLPKIISRYKVGEIAQFQIIRQGEVLEIPVEIVELPQKLPNQNSNTLSIGNINSKNSYKFLDITAINLTADHKNKLKIAQSIEGVLITNVEPKSQAALKGVLKGDIIITANQNSFKNIRQLKKIVKKEKGKTNKLMLFIKRSDTNYPVVLDLE